MMHKVEEDASVVLLAAKEALARGNINFIRYELNELLQLFRINLDPNCQDYRKVAIAVIKAEVRALEDVRVSMSTLFELPVCAFFDVSLKGGGAAPRRD